MGGTLGRRVDSRGPRECTKATVGWRFRTHRGLLPTRYRLELDHLIQKAARPVRSLGPASSLGAKRRDPVAILRILACDPGYEEPSSSMVGSKLDGVSRCRSSRKQYGVKPPTSQYREEEVGPPPHGGGSRVDESALERRRQRGKETNPAGRQPRVDVDRASIEVEADESIA